MMDNNNSGISKFLDGVQLEQAQQDQIYSSGLWDEYEKALVEIDDEGYQFHELSEHSLELQIVMQMMFDDEIRQKHKDWCIKCQQITAKFVQRAIEIINK
jgi:hypothetical protein